MKTSLIFIASCFALCAMISCSDEKTKCNGGSFTEIVRNDNLTQSQFQTFNWSVNDKTVYYNYSFPGHVRFGIGKTLHNICPGKNVSVVFSVKTSADYYPKVFQVYGTSRWSSVIGGFASDLVFINDTIISDHLYVSENEIELKEAFGENVAEMDVFISIDFDKLNSYEEDSTYFVNHIETLKIVAEGDLFE